GGAQGGSVGGRTEIQRIQGVVPQVQRQAEGRLPANDNGERNFGLWGPAIRTQHRRMDRRRIRGLALWRLKRKRNLRLLSPHYAHTAIEGGGYRTHQNSIGIPPGIWAS